MPRSRNSRRVIAMGLLHDLELGTRQDQRDEPAELPVHGLSVEMERRRVACLARLKVVREGASIAAYVNGRRLTTVNDGSFTGLRRIGLRTYAPSDGARDIRFDNFSLYPASCGVSVAGVGFEMGQPEIHEGPVSPGVDQAP